MTELVVQGDVKALVEKLEKAKADHLSLHQAFSAKELDAILIPEEAASIASVLAGRRISTDYIKRMRLDERLPAIKINQRAYVYKLRDLLLVQYRKPYTRKPPGRPPKPHN